MQDVTYPAKSTSDLRKVARFRKSSESYTFDKTYLVRRSCARFAYRMHPLTITAKVRTETSSYDLSDIALDIHTDYFKLFAVVTRG